MARSVQSGAEHVFAIAILTVILWGTPAAAGSGRASSSKEFFTLLAQPDVETIYLDTDILLSISDAPPSPINLTRSVTVEAGVPSPQLANLAAEYISNKVRLQPGVTLTFRRIVLSGILRGTGQHLDMLSRTDGGSVVYEDTINHRTACLPFPLFKDQLVSLPDPSKEAGIPEIAANILYKNISVIYSTSLCWTSASGKKSCRVPYLDMFEYGTYNQPSTSLVPNIGGYNSFFIHSYGVCDEPVSQECLNSKGPDLCLVEAVSRAAAGDAANSGGSSSTPLAAGLGVGLGVALLLAVIFMFLILRSHMRHRKAMSYTESANTAARMNLSSGSAAAGQGLGGLSDLEKGGMEGLSGSGGPRTGAGGGTEGGRAAAGTGASSGRSRKGEEAAAMAMGSTALSCSDRSSSGATMEASSVLGVGAAAAGLGGGAQRLGEGGVTSQAGLGEVEAARLNLLANAARGRGGRTAPLEVQVLQLLGQGSFGKVYKGIWHGTLVALKAQVLPPSLSGDARRRHMAVMEAAISSAINHPAIVQTYCYSFRPIRDTVGATVIKHARSAIAEEAQGEVAAAAGDGGGVEGGDEDYGHELLLVLEFCDCGSLREALDRGTFHRGRPWPWDWRRMVQAAAAGGAGTMAQPGGGIIPSPGGAGSGPGMQQPRGPGAVSPQSGSIAAPGGAPPGGVGTKALPAPDGVSVPLRLQEYEPNFSLGAFALIVPNATTVEGEALVTAVGASGAGAVAESTEAEAGGGDGEPPAAAATCGPATGGGDNGGGDNRGGDNGAAATAAATGGGGGNEAAAATGGVAATGGGGGVAAGDSLMGGGLMLAGAPTAASSFMSSFANGASAADNAAAAAAADRLAMMYLLQQAAAAAVAAASSGDPRVRGYAKALADYVSASNLTGLGSLTGFSGSGVMGSAAVDGTLSSIGGSEETIVAPPPGVLAEAPTEATAATLALAGFQMAPQSTAPPSIGSAASREGGGAGDGSSRAQPAIRYGLMLAMAADVASGLLHLHAHGVVHGDVKASNVLLKQIVVSDPWEAAGRAINEAASMSPSAPPTDTSAAATGPQQQQQTAGPSPQQGPPSQPQTSMPSQLQRNSAAPSMHSTLSVTGHPPVGLAQGPRLGLCAKVSDFGLSTMLSAANTDTHISATTAAGSLSHMSPELLLCGHVSKANDVYAFGVLLFELFTGERAWEGMPRALLPARVALEGWRPVFPPHTPNEYRQLAEKCWVADPAKRPTFEEIVVTLKGLRDSALASRVTDWVPVANPQLSFLHNMLLQQQQQLQKRSQGSSAASAASAQPHSLR